MKSGKGLNNSLDGSALLRYDRVKLERGRYSMTQEKKKRKDTQAKKDWYKANMVFTAFKMFREIDGKRNDQDIIDFLEKQESKSYIIKEALRYYMTNHP